MARVDECADDVTAEETRTSSHHHAHGAPSSTTSSSKPRSATRNTEKLCQKQVPHARAATRRWRHEHSPRNLCVSMHGRKQSEEAPRTYINRLERAPLENGATETVTDERQPTLQWPDHLAPGAVRLSYSSVNYDATINFYRDVV